LKTEWTIHPFAWELKPHAKPIKIDWEHTEVQFVKPADLPKHDHVPLLEVGMNRVLVNDETEDGIQVLRSDHQSGAQALAVKALEILLNSVQKGSISKTTGAEDFWKELRLMAWHLGKNGRPSMAAAIESQLFKALNVVRTKINDEGKEELPLQSVKETAEEAIKAGIAASKHTLDRLSDSFVKFIKSRPAGEGKSDQTAPVRIVTLSSSGTITQCLSHLISTVSATQGISLTVLESRPKFEGVSFVNNLLTSLQTKSINNNNLEISLVSDASTAAATRNADYLVLGGDKVLRSGDVCNKMGSLSTAVITKTINPKCHVIATFDTSKITTSSFEEDHSKAENNEEAEMVAAWPKEAYEKLQAHRGGKFKIEVQNAYFEWVAAKWIDTYISEEGVLKVSDIEKLGRQTRELEDDIFRDL
jgi:translation initiation factor 2B subunit (eIF-2B alpha/beta/delta family)